MNVTLSIDRKGHLPGSLGWLAENAHRIKIGATKDGKSRGAWLQDADGKTITVLAISDAYECDATAVNLVERCYMSNPIMGSDQEFTDAAWAVVENIAEQAAELLRESAELAQTVSVSIA